MSFPSLVLFSLVDMYKYLGLKSFIISCRKEAKELQSRSSKGEKRPASENIPERIKRYKEFRCKLIPLVISRISKSFSPKCSLFGVSKLILSNLCLWLFKFLNISLSASDVNTSPNCRQPVILKSHTVLSSMDRRTVASYRELDARKNRVNELEKIYMDMTMQKELQVFTPKNLPCCSIDYIVM